MEDKLKLIKALEAERDRFNKLGHDTTEHEITIDYLKTGTISCFPIQVSNYPLLDCAINDYDTLLSDYVL